jgi:hypothetical protein
MPFREEKIRRLIRAIGENIDGWMAQISEIESGVPHETQIRCHHILMSMEGAKRALAHLTQDAEKD